MTVESFEKWFKNVEYVLGGINPYNPEEKTATGPFPIVINP